MDTLRRDGSIVAADEGGDVGTLMESAEETFRTANKPVNSAYIAATVQAIQVFCGLITRPKLLIIRSTW